jgi:TatD DNase family protein
VKPGMVDSHAHLTAPQFEADRSDVIQRALDAGVSVIINPATDVADSERAIHLAEKYPQVYACVGIHPHEAAKAGEGALARIEELSRHERVVAIGEIGLDYHYDFSPRDVQKRIFDLQLDIARRRNLPVVIHTRESLPETIAIVEESLKRPPLWRGEALSGSRYPAPRGVFHCFPGTVEEAWRVIDLGFAISFPGILTFKNAGVAPEVARSVSLEHILLETDSPYMTPAPHRGERNEPKHLGLVAQKLSELQRLSVEDVARSTGYTAFRIFGVGKRGEPRITYTLRDALYVNLTIRCNADCVFCDRKGDAIIKGHNLKIEREPTADEVILEIGDPTRYREIVFCGYGEPSIRLEELKEVARWVKAHGGATRLNTDGHGNIINKRNIVPELVGLLDAVSISLNSPDPRQYGELMRVDGERFFAAMVEFAKECVRLLPRTVMTVVDLDEVQMDRARRLVEEEIGAGFQVRPFF